MAQLHLSQMRDEPLVAVARLFLASFVLFALLLDPAAGQEARTTLIGLLVGYLVYALLMFLDMQRRRPAARDRLLRHGADVVIVLLLCWFSKGSSGTLFPFFAFLLFAGSLRRWQRGTVWSSICVLTMFVGLGTYDAVFRAYVFELDEFIVRSASLALLAVLLARFRGFENQVRADLQKLASEPEITLTDVDSVLLALLGWVSSIMHASRAIIVWEEHDEPWLHVASWQRGEYEHVREPPGVFDPLVCLELGDVSFLCHDVSVPRARVLRAAGKGFGWWRGEPLNEKFRLEHSITSVMSMPLETDTVKGWLFLADRFDDSPSTPDHLVMGNIVAHRVSGWLNRIGLARRAAEEAASGERVRVARDLHDGAFHGLTGVALELERLIRVGNTVSDDEPLRQIQHSVADTQQTLRTIIAGLRGAPPDSSQLPTGLSIRLHEFCGRLERQWGLRVEYSITGLEVLPPGRSNDVYFFVHEALVNVARHARASSARLEIARENADLRITVTDDGCGLGGDGGPDKTTAFGLGGAPESLRERAALLGGSLVIASSAAGTRVELRVPVACSIP